MEIGFVNRSLEQTRRSNEELLFLAHFRKNLRIIRFLKQTGALTDKLGTEVPYCKIKSNFDKNMKIWEVKELQDIDYSFAMKNFYS